MVNFLTLEYSAEHQLFSAGIYGKAAEKPAADGVVSGTFGMYGTFGTFQTYGTFRSLFC